MEEQKQFTIRKLLQGDLLKGTIVELNIKVLSEGD